MIEEPVAAMIKEPKVLDLRSLESKDEIWLRRWIAANGDMALGSHSQIKDYFLADSTSFGATGVFHSEIKSPYPVAAFFWSRTETKSFIHHVAYSLKFAYDRSAIVEAAYDWLERPQCQLFVQGISEVRSDSWDLTLLVNAGDVTDHSAYDGVFSRTAPRFDGFVFERKSNASTDL